MLKDNHGANGEKCFALILSHLLPNSRHIDNMTLNKNVVLVPGSGGQLVSIPALFLITELAIHSRQ